MFQKVNIFLILGLSLTLLGSNLEAKGALPSEAETESKERSPLLRSVVILNRKENLIVSPEELQFLKGLVCWGIDIPGSQGALEKELFSSSRRMDLETVEEVKRLIYRHYLTQSHPFIVITIPSQKLSEGVLQVVVYESRLGEIKIEGNRWSSTERVKNYMQIKPGEPINSSRLLKNLQFVNRNPFRKADLIYSAGKEENTTDVDVVIDEDRPYSFYVGTDNTGIQTIGRGRVFAGINWSNAFNLDHFFSFQYTSSYDFHKFKAFSTQYLVPFSWGHLLNVYGGYSQVHVRVPSPGKRNHGMAAQGSFRYTVPLEPISSLSHEIEGGFDLKSTNNTVEFVELLPMYSHLVNLSQFTLGYALQQELTSSTHRFKASVFYSPGSLFPHESNQDYNALREGARNKWVYGNAQWRYIQKLPHSFSLFLNSQLQFSSQTLLPSEELGMGGFDTVRGYEERQYNADSGLLLSLEARSPAFSFFSRSTYKDALQFLAFIDYGVGTDHTPVPTLQKNGYLLGIGPGVRYSIDPFLSIRCDWGIKLHRKSDFNGGWSMLYFSLIANY